MRIASLPPMILLLLWITVSQKSQAQTNNNQEFAQIGTLWHYNFNNFGGGQPNSSYHKLESVGDTLIAGKNCRIIRTTFFPPFSNDSIVQSPEYVYMAGDTVYYYHRYLNQFSPLYMFNAQVGDTLHFDYPHLPLFASVTPFRWKARIDSITHYIQGSDTLKMFWPRTLPNTDSMHLNADFLGAYIEKIGGTVQFMHQPFVIIPEWNGPIRCYQDPQLSVNFMQIPCNQRAGLSVDKLAPLASVRFYPNPAKEVFYLQNDHNGTVQYSVFNSQGQLLLQNEIQANENKTINTEYWPTGMYLLRLQSQQLMRYEKLLIKQ